MAQLSNSGPNQVERMFYGQVIIQFASSLFFYEQHGIVQRLIHQLKYHGKEDLGSLFGKWMVEELRYCQRLPKIDYVLPVPLSPNKLKKRGYNQVSRFGQEIARCLDAIFLVDNLRSKSSGRTQTQKNREDRWHNVKNQFYLRNPDVFDHASVLIVDDVITTGATLSACCQALQQSKQVKISIVSMAFTS